jgi:hypothetical protein
MLTTDQKRQISGGCWIPETMRKTHLVRVDRMARALFEADEDMAGNIDALSSPRAKWEDHDSIHDAYRYRAAKALETLPPEMKRP